MELDKSNMVSMLSFDSRLVNCLLESELEHQTNDYHLSPEYPLFYKIRHVYTDHGHVHNETTTALDIALDNNQIKAAAQIVEYK